MGSFFFCLLSLPDRNLETSMRFHSIPDMLSVTIQRRERIITVCGFLSSVYCISPRAVYSERTYQQPQGEALGARLGVVFTSVMR